MRTPVKFAGVGALVLLAGTALSTSASAQVTYDRLLNPEPDNWLTHNRTYDGHRYSPLDEINTGNVGDLDLAFAVSLIPRPVAGLGGGLHATPLVDNGILYITDGAGAVYRIDVSSGRQGYINWIQDPQTDPETAGIVNNRGVALLGDSVYSLTRDGYLTATNAASGEVEWDVATQIDPDEYFTMAPLALEDRIVFGPAGDAPMRGWMEARSAADGSELWRFWTVAGPGEPGGETWPSDSDIYLSGASGLWTTGSYDPDTNLIYWGTANPTPFGDPDLRPGDNLYSSSLVVINAESGALEWYFQYTPNEQWDYDEIGSHQLYDAGGQARVQHFGRNGFAYVLDATDGTFINGVPYVEQITWTAGLDPKTGLPIEYDPALASGGIQQYAHGAFAGETQVAGEFCPNIQGGVNFQPTSHSDRTNWTYGSSIEGCSTAGAFGISERTTGAIVAADVDGNIAAKASIPFVPYGGTVTTGGGLVFSSMVNGDFFAMDDETLEVLWSVNLGSPIDAPPIVYGVNGKEFVAIPVGTSNISSLFSNGGYLAAGDDPNAASVANSQRTWTIYVFAL
ncbi:MAG: PQQ-binding-like beta-propeller repeat protein [Bauldia sp.]|nr:PQQ-binding-like beta-propeller repeat protein [Bauldia sp.]